MLKRQREWLSTIAQRYFTPKEYKAALLFLGLGLAVGLVRGGKYLWNEWFPSARSAAEIQVQRHNDSVFAELSRERETSEKHQFWMPEQAIDSSEQQHLHTAKKGEGLAEHSLSINKADSSALTQLPGVGKVMASRIIAYRNERGKYRSLNELMNVEGIGEAKFKKMEPFIKLD